MLDDRKRNVLVNLPRILRDIIEGVLEHEPDMEVVGEFRKRTELLDAVDETGADFVITGAEDADVAGVRSLLRARPDVKVLAVGEDGRQTLLYELRPRMVRLGEISPQTLLEAIRAAARATPFEQIEALT
jgi:DNA-binding NarL/FixJ family response regulator